MQRCVHEAVETPHALAGRAADEVGFHGLSHDGISRVARQLHLDVFTPHRYSHRAPVRAARAATMRSLSIRLPRKTSVFTVPSGTPSIVAIVS